VEFLRNILFRVALKTPLHEDQCITDVIPSLKASQLNFSIQAHPLTKLRATLESEQIGMGGGNSAKLLTKVQQK